MAVEVDRHVAARVVDPVGLVGVDGDGAGDVAEEAGQHVEHDVPRAEEGDDAGGDAPPREARARKLEEGLVLEDGERGDADLVACLSSPFRLCGAKFVMRIPRNSKRKQNETENKHGRRTKRGRRTMAYFLIIINAQKNL